MTVEAARLRNSAKNCREQAKEARDETARRELYHLAAELEIEADRIDEEEGVQRHSVARRIELTDDRLPPNERLLSTQSGH